MISTYVKKKLTMFKIINSEYKVHKILTLVKLI